MTEDSIPHWLKEEDALSLDRVLLRHCALLPGTTESEIRSRRVIRFVICIIMITMIIGDFIELYNSRSSFMNIIQCMSIGITLTKCLIKFIVVIQHEKELRYVLEKLMTNFYIHENIFKEKIISTIKEKKKTAWWISIPYICNFISTIVLMGLDKTSSLVYRPSNEPEYRNDTNETVAFTRLLPLRVWLPINQQLSPQYEIGYFYQLIVFAYIIYSTTIIDTFIAVIMMYVSTQFELLGSSIRQAKENVSQLLEMKYINVHNIVVEDGTGTDESLEWREEMDNYLRLCVLRHQSLFEFMNRMNLLSSPIEFVQAVTSSILLCTLGFTAIYIGDVSILPRLMMYTSNILLQIGLPCYYATQLQVQSLNIADAAYSCEWYNEPVSFQKSICMIIMRAQKPVYIYFGPFGTLSLELFATVVQSAYTYITLLRQVYE
ncbi:hypothetical protein L9F63_022166 [Diploptera punctata]|uniref:Odorant receptor n=1 Tax=Diploptera punctata TaxID=6984 RepID=A0AAD7ZMK2_DIPPU|nr:hypothetical protein L9F63_022166 [Diploptera punctata]